MNDMKLALFLNWFIKHYNTAGMHNLVYYTNANEEEVSIAEIIEHYNRER